MNAGGGDDEMVGFHGPLLRSCLKMGSGRAKWSKGVNTIPFSLIFRH